ncbi:MAG TPA: exosortase A [Telluria sp.]|mgnify:CR=1 FL=1|nr:exosortase A [Telluria sp.]
MLDTTLPQPRTYQPHSWGFLVPLLVPLLALFALYFSTAKSIVSIWDSSDTFTHGYIILPISIWLIWRRRGNFFAYPPTPYWPAVAGLAMLGAAWLVARQADVQVVAQYAFVMMFPMAALAMFGWRLAKSFTFPLLFLLFAVPFGEVFVDPLINFTADFTVAAVRATGIPLLRNGTRFEIPTGSWSVVTACSGVRYLISSVTIGCLYAYLTYASTKKRVICILLAIIVPIIANGLRAYMIVMIGHLSGMELATGVDHIVYGWLFFGLVMFIMFWIGNRWREDEAVTPVPVDTGALGAAAIAARRGRMLPIAAAVLLVTAMWPLLSHWFDQANHRAAPAMLDPVTLSAPAVAPFTTWTPNFMTPDAAMRTVTKASPGTPSVFANVLYYHNQQMGKLLISSSNTLAHEDDAYHAIGVDIRSVSLGGAPLVVRETRMSGPSGTFLVWQWYWIDGHRTASSIKGKLLQARSKLLLRGDGGAAVILAAPYVDNNDDPARAALEAYVAANGVAIEKAIEAANAR